MIFLIIASCAHTLWVIFSIWQHFNNRILEEALRHERDIYAENVKRLSQETEFFKMGYEAIKRQNLEEEEKIAALRNNGIQ